MHVAAALDDQSVLDPFLLEGYDEDTVDDFLRAVSDEKARLQDVIDAARVRQNRARAVLGLHEAMVAAMLDAYRDVTERRRAAESRAAAIRAARVDAPTPKEAG
jgi:cell division septum initiation protein DivIVA